MDSRSASIVGLAACSVLASLFFSPLAVALNRVDMTPIEYRALPAWCRSSQTGSVANAGPGRGVVAEVPVSEAQKRLRWQVGGWHFCNGLVKLRRAELMPRSPEMTELATQAKGDMSYSIKRIDPAEPWAAFMQVSRARVYRLLEERKEAREDLEAVRKYHPRYAPAYTALAQLEFDDGDFPAAIAILKEGVEQTKGRSAELQYYLGLAYLYNGDLEDAKQQEKIARSLNYPFDGLARKIAEQER